MLLDELKSMVQQDLEIDKTELDVEALKTPQLHNKYLNFLLDEKLILTKAESELRILRKIKWLYYTGKMSHEELEERDLEPFALNILKQDLEKFLESDDEIVKLTNKVEYQKEKVEYLKSVVKTMSDRQWYIRSAIDWIKFTNGN
jgi:hypothetical protein|tara:strand:- start:287 stop:721 length:435 start_codon:yes stop_codon:yes gene_type:complete